MVHKANRLQDLPEIMESSKSYKLTSKPSNSTRSRAKKRNRTELEESSKSTGLASSQKKLPNFVSSLRIILHDSPKSIISWSRDGSAFYIYDKKTFTKNIQTKYYQSTSFSSFVRQLNFYQFKKVSNDEVKKRLKPKRNSNTLLCFHHPHFHRDKPEMMHLIVRKVNQTATDREMVNLKEKYSTLAEKFEDVLKHVAKLSKQVEFLQSRLDGKNGIKNGLSLNIPLEQKQVKRKRRSIHRDSSHLAATVLNPPPLERFNSSDYAFLAQNLSPRHTPRGEMGNSVGVHEETILRPLHIF